jgi:hypothetical protein
MRGQPPLAAESSVGLFDAWDAMLLLRGRKVQSMGSSHAGPDVRVAQKALRVSHSLAVLIAEERGK